MSQALKILGFNESVNPYIELVDPYTGKSRYEGPSNPEEKEALATLNEVYSSIETTVAFQSILDLEKIASGVKGFQKVVGLNVSPTSGAGSAILCFVTEDRGGVIALFFEDPVAVMDKDGGWKGREVTLHKEGKVSPLENIRILRELQVVLKKANSSLEN